jgi:hypothetical protein
VRGWVTMRLSRGRAVTLSSPEGACTRSGTPAPARPLEVIAPAGFEAYFAELAEAGDPGRRQELAAKYGVTYSSDWVAELISRYNLKLLGQ